ncbi:MAG: DUF2752 domain-containing protein [Algicola sp.]|nr:DUF2752 domain-containing protein [Algicola sp.]
MVMMSPEDYMLPCLNKQLLGFDCMGCGLQRSFAFILKGNFIDAFFMYPAIYSLIAFFGFILLNTFMDFKNSNKIIVTLAIINITLILGNFILKLINQI